MTNEWRDLPTMQDVAAALAAGEEIQDDMTGTWTGWIPTDGWGPEFNFRARPHKPATKTIVLRRALMHDIANASGYYETKGTFDFSTSAAFCMWLPGEEVVEVPT